MEEIIMNFTDAFSHAVSMLQVTLILTYTQNKTANRFNEREIEEISVWALTKYLVGK